MKNLIESLLQRGLKKLSDEAKLSLPNSFSINIERPRDPSHGDFSTNLAMVLAKTLAIAPRTLSERLIAQLPQHEDIEKVEIAGPGFINFTLSEQSLQKQIGQIWNSESCGILNTAKGRVVVDYSSPNLAKEMHVGHLRSTIIGDALARALEFQGYQVIRQNHVGDWGTQFGMLLAHLEDQEHIHHGEVELNDLESFYKAAKSRFDKEEDFAYRARQKVVKLQAGDSTCLKLWERFIKLSLAHCQELYSRLGISLTASDVKAESSYNELLPQILSLLNEQHLVTEHEGADCVFLEQFKGKNAEILPIIVKKKDGGFLYATTDLAAIFYRQNTLDAERVLYVVDARQALHFQQIFALAYKAGFAKPTTELEHISFGMVLDKSGKPFKSREGGVTKLVDLLNEAEIRARKLIESKQLTENYAAEELKKMAEVLGLASIKYADLSKNRSSDYIFDWDQMISFEGNTAPYLLYAYTRIKSLEAKGNMDDKDLNGPLIFESAQDLALTKKLILFPELIEDLTAKSAPHLLCAYLYELAGIFSGFYEACPILSHENEAIKISRFKLAKLTARILKLGLYILGIKTLKRM